MKNILLPIFIMMSLFSSNGIKAQVDYKKGALDALINSYNDLESAVSNLTQDELYYKPKDGGWSVMNCLEHLAIVEELLVGKISQSIAENNVDMTKDLSANDWLVISQVGDRGNKVVTPEPFRPKVENAKKTKEDFLKGIKDLRNELIALVEKTDVDLRHIFGPYPYGEADGIQRCYVVGVHTFRHTMQLKEVLKEYDENTSSQVVSKK